MSDDPARLSRRQVLAGSIAVTAVTASGCSTLVPWPLRRSSETSSTTPTKAAGRVLPADYVWQSPQDMTTLPAPATPAGVLLRTPHAGLAQEASATYARIDSAMAATYGIPGIPTEGAVAAQGHELVGFSLTAQTPPYAPSRKEPVFSLRIGERTEPVKLFGAYNDVTKLFVRTREVFIVSVPAGAPLKLLVKDSGRTSVVGLRLGQLGKDADTQSNRGFWQRRRYSYSDRSMTWKASYRTSPPAGYLSQSDWIKIGLTIDPDNTGVSPWRPGRGYAKRGKTFLVIGVKLSTSFHKGLYGVIKKLDLKEAFTLSAGGKKYHPSSIKINSTDLITRLDPYYLTFVVPENLSSATLTFNPGKAPEVKYNNLPKPTPTYYTQRAAVKTKLTIKKR